MAKKLLLVDTNILSHALTPNKTNAYFGLFKKLEKEYRFVVTGYTVFELLCSSDKEHREKILTYVNEEMTYVELSKVLMNFTARICYLYSKHESTIGKKIGAGDMVNASFAIIKDCPILTIDNNDHPNPFFKEICRERVTFTSKKRKEHTDTVYMLEPDNTHIKNCFDIHEV